MDNRSRLHTKLVSMYPDFTKDSEACRKKWAAIYNDYKEDKVMNAKSGSQRSEKCRWYQLVDEFMYDKANVVSHAHASAVNPDGPKGGATSDPNTSEICSGESTSKSPEPKRKEEIFLERCIGEIKDGSISLMQGMKSSDDMKMAFTFKHAANNAEARRKTLGSCFNSYHVPEKFLQYKPLFWPSKDSLLFHSF